MQAQLNKILEEAKEQLQQAASVSDVDEIRVKLLGKKSSVGGGSCLRMNERELVKWQTPCVLKSKDCWNVVLQI